MGASGPDRQKQQHMHAIRGKDKPKEEKETTIGEPEQYDQDNTIQRQKRTRRTQNIHKQVRRKVTEKAPPKGAARPTTEKKKEMRKRN